MTDSTEPGENTCRALSADGSRCEHPPQDDGFCHQHDATDPAVDQERKDGASEQDGEDWATDAGRDGSLSSLLRARRTVASAAPTVTGAPLDGVLAIEDDDDGWRAVVEVVERRSVPDTQDILGRYEIQLEDVDRISSYRRLSRYRRSDTDREQHR